MTELESAKIVAVLLAAFPSAKTTSGTEALYESMLLPLEYAVVNAAVASIIATTRFPTLPTVGEIRATCLELQAGPRRAGGDAWGEVRRAIQTKGAYRMPGRDLEFSEPLTARAVDALGWQELCLSEMQSADRARFIELYEQLATSARKESATSQLPAVKAYRELQAARRGEVQGIGELLKLVAGGGQ